MITIRSLPASDERFRAILPASRGPLPSESAGLEADLDGLFAGLALVVPDCSTGIGRIEALHTPELFRNLGVGSRLLLEAERRLLDAGCRRSRIDVTVRRGGPSPEMDFLRKRGYGGDTLRRRTYTLRTSGVANEGWFDRLRLPERAALIPLLSAGVDERRQVAELLMSGVPSDLDPFREERRLHVEFSLLLKLGGQVAGWASVQETASNLLLVRTMYARPELRLPGGGFALLAEILRRFGLPERYAYLTFNVAGDNEAMLRIADRKLTRHAANVKSLIRLEKEL
ncbi:hypothetical protein CDO73_17450 [Saccharibacillus sp. O23]|uniref:GNAT family N-acetyltransferase n=1 Tax=Saccharibacillus sp. O23 TaxID=2009338 RepID=UPI000B4E3155|nr:GNAT family N-acetyltransferase [Saccharibacillus sp. O23]OWR28686.1 hypothetical protein CDO73_17450 [Saccharibacillus sp. O23]